MSKIKRGLGKGLEALFEENTVESNEDGMTKLKLTEIEPNSKQPRSKFELESLEELSASIMEHGILSPLIVRPLPAGNYEIVAGERRWRAARMADMKEIPVIIKTLSNTQATQIALIENIQRKDLNPIEEAFGYRSLMEEFNMTQEEVAKGVSKSRSSIANSLRLLNLPEKILGYIRNSQISTGHGKVLLGLESNVQNKLVSLILENDISVRETEKLVKQLDGHKKKKNITKKENFNIDSYFMEVELSMNEQLGHKVLVNAKKGKGKLEIYFNDKEELKSIISKLL